MFFLWDFLVLGELLRILPGFALYDGLISLDFSGLSWVLPEKFIARWSSFPDKDLHGHLPTLSGKSRSCN